MKRIRLTLERIRVFACPPDKQQAFLADTDSPGLAVRATRGSKSFIHEGKLNHRTIRTTIGDTRAWTLDAARVEATARQAQMDRKIDSRVVRQEGRAAEDAARAATEAAAREKFERANYTLRALLAASVRHLRTRGKTRSAGAAQSAFKCHVLQSKIADTPAREVTSRQIAELVRKVREKGLDRCAGVLRSYLHSAYSAARKSPLDASLPAEFIPFNIESNPVEAVPAIAVARGTRTLSFEELRIYLSNLGTSLPDVALRLALLAGGQRMAQLLRATVADFSASASTLRLYDPKGKRKTPREHVLPLAPEATALASALVERAKKQKFKSLFASDADTVMAFETPGKRAAEICAGMNGESFNLRDVRRSAETLMAGMGINRETRAHLLSHGLSGVQNERYDMHAYYDEKAAALVAWEAQLAELVSGGIRATNVFAFRVDEKAAA